MTDDELQRWVEKKVGRPVEQTANGFLLTRRELGMLAAGPSPWCYIAIFVGVGAITLLISSAAHHWF